ncbi:response regulator [Ferruginibacter sp. HRS2-29]|uniref:response regulator n=1 Tax=Ferruginibacter sp. HRS2-29 TaxID=2487334 RepID=UPI0020CFB909|nr:response regulator [Ferruginibacter sp. HRS2-29]MCP9750398.1 response regulator [Ferruginibacter sp. HRS2-29]
MKKKDLKVLIVDNALLVVSRVSEIISELDCVMSVSVATTYEEAVKKISLLQPDIVLLDIYLKDKSGLELLEFIKRSHPSIKAIMLTNQSSDNYKNLCEKIGSDHFIDKSSEFENITGIIESYHV